MGGAAARADGRMVAADAALSVLCFRRSCGVTPHPAAPKLTSFAKAPHPSPTRGEEGLLRRTGEIALEHLFECRAQRHVELRHRHEVAELRERGDAKRLPADPARYDPAEVAEVGIDVDRDAVVRHPAPHAHADRRDLVLAALVRDPDADSASTPLAGHVEARQRADDPLLEIAHEAAHIGPALF